MILTGCRRSFKTNGHIITMALLRELISFLDELMNSRKVILTYFGNHMVEGLSRQKKQTV